MVKSTKLSPSKVARIIQGRLLKLPERKIAAAVPCSKRTVQRHTPVAELLQFVTLLADQGVVTINDLEPPSSPPPK